MMEDGSAATQKRASAKTATETYQKLTQLEHVLKRPDTYIGSVEADTRDMWVYDKPSSQMVYKKITFVPGLYKIVDEILVNAADNKIRDSTMDALKVTINREEGSISVWNNGKGIPIEKHEKEGIYIPELIFGHLLTSSNYDDDEKKVTGGRNGYGAKLANIYSTEFTVETADREQKYRQTFTENMSKKGSPKLLKNSKKEEYTHVTFKPDFQRFGMTSIDDDTEALLMKRVYDMAGTVKNCKVFLNGERLKIRNFKQYVEMYVNAVNQLGGVKKEENEEDLGAAAVPKQNIIYETVNDRWEIAFAVSDGTPQQVSFVNGIATIKGGTHVHHVVDQITSKLIEALKKKNKAAPVKPHQIKNHLWVFVNALIENPAFDSQTKETLTLKQSAFGSKCNITDGFMKKVVNSGVMDNILAFARFKQDQELKKTDGKASRTRITGISKLDDANNAGGRTGKNCTLILTEGDSAKALAVSGLTVVGRDNFGVFALRGKLLNVREASHDSIMKNLEIQHIKTILGLQHQKQYTSTDGLRYGSLMIMTDQDHDGSHIKGLLINFLDHFYPSLLKIPGFLVEFVTPIVKVWKGKKEISFFTIPEYEQWKEENNDGKGWTHKYYKGLGTSGAADAKKYFSDMAKHRLPFAATQPGDRELIDMAFNKKKADDRKEWLRQFKPGTYIDHNVSEISHSDFINRELILFSMADNVRSIPSSVDGFKPGQRKVLFGCFKRKLRGEIKVAQLAGYVSEHSAYHHGEQSLTMTIVGLAQNFVGNNNINVLSPNGQFGTRAQGGKDAASARYIFTSLPSITRTIFNPADDNLLNYLNDDGQSIEPEWYMPILPMVLVNGSEGIGTGWSSSVPNYNPRDIVDNIRRRMQGQEYVPMNPWYRGFSGTIEKVSSDRYKVTGIARWLDDVTVEITELPIRTWTQPYKDMLEERVQGTEKVPPTIKDWKDNSTHTTVHLTVTLTPKGADEARAKGLEVFFKLASQISTGNMVCFDHQGKIKKFTAPEEILEDFYPLRLQFYQKRKEYTVKELTDAWEKLSNQARFVQMIVTKKLSVSNRKRADIVEELRELKFRPFPKQIKAKVAGDVDGVDGGGDEGEELSESDTDFDYLLGMAIWSLTKEKVEKLLKERDLKEEELNILLGKSAVDLWNADMDSFLEEWENVLKQDEMDALDDVKSRKAAKTAAAKGKKGGAAARRVIKKKILHSDGEEESDVSMNDDSEDDYAPVKKKGKAATAAAAPAGKTRTSPLRKSSATSKEPLKTVKTELVKTEPVKAATKVVKKKKKALDSDGEEEEDIHISIDDDSADDYAPVKKTAKAGPKVAKKKRAVNSDSEEEDANVNMEEESADDYAPSKKKSTAAASWTGRAARTTASTTSKATKNDPLSEITPFSIAAGQKSASSTKTRRVGGNGVAGGRSASSTRKRPSDGLDDDELDELYSFAKSKPAAKRRA